VERRAFDDQAVFDLQDLGERLLDRQAGISCGRGQRAGREERAAIERRPEVGDVHRAPRSVHALEQPAERRMTLPVAGMRQRGRFVHDDIRMKNRGDAPKSSPSDFMNALSATHIRVRMSIAAAIRFHARSTAAA